MGERGTSWSGRRDVRRYSNLTGFEDGLPLTMLSVDGSNPANREISFRWLAGTVLTGVTSVLMMGAALYVSFSGVDSFSTAYKAMDVAVTPASAPAAEGKTDRQRPVLATTATRDEVEASVLQTGAGTDTIRNTTFVRVNATLATAVTSITDDVADYNPSDYIDAVEDDIGTATAVSLDIVGEPVDAEVAIATSTFPAGYTPPRAIDDADAAAFLAIGTSELGQDYALAYAPQVSVMQASMGMAVGVAENVTVVPRSPVANEEQRVTERIVKLDEPTDLADALLRNGFSEQTAAMVLSTVQNVVPVSTLPARSRLRILLGPSRTGPGLIPHRLSIYRHDDATNSDSHVATVALTDTGKYVLGLAPAAIPFSEESTERINVANLPSIYKAIWETGRRNELDDPTIAKIIALVAYDIDLSKKIQPGDEVELLQSEATDTVPSQLLYVGLKLGNISRTFYRFRTEDGSVAYFDETGESGKRFLLRRPLEGGGRLTSAMGSRIDPINGGNANHKGTDFAAPRGTPIYAAADGTIEMAQWYSGFGRYVRLSHANGYRTAYAHMNQIADGITSGGTVRQGQVIGYVGSTGRSTGNHLHFELEINGRVADPLEVKLPRARTLPGQYAEDLKQTIDQVKSIMSAQGDAA